MVLNLRLLHYFLHLEGHPRSLSFSVMAHPNGKEIIIADRLEDTRSGGRAMNQRFRIKDPMARPPRPGTLLSPTHLLHTNSGIVVDPTSEFVGDEWGEERRVEVVAGSFLWPEARFLVLAIEDRDQEPRKLRPASTTSWTPSRLIFVFSLSTGAPSPGEHQERE